VLAFVPLLVYLVMAPLSVSLALWLAFAAVFAVAIRAFIATGSLRPFDAVGLVLFGGLAFYDGFIDPGGSATRTSMVIEIGFLAGAVWSMGMRLPFTAQYGLLPERCDPVLLDRANTLLTAVWSTCFALMAGANAWAVVLHRLSPIWASGLGLAAFAAALTFTWQFGLYIDKHLVSWLRSPPDR
jgi:hypothetical protein